MALPGRLSDALSSEWKLLTETAAYLAKTPDFGAHEAELTDIRNRLRQAAPASRELKLLRSEIVALRKRLRSQGHDVSLGSESIVFQGFRSDDCLRLGFRRAVLSFEPGGISFMEGQENHVEIQRMLEDRLIRAGRPAAEFHYLWFRRQGRVLYLSGSDTESKEGWERFQKLYAAHPLLFLSSLRSLG